MSGSADKKDDSATDRKDAMYENARRAVAALSEQDRDRLRMIIGSVTKASCGRIMQLADTAAGK